MTTHIIAAEEVILKNKTNPDYQQVRSKAIEESM